MGDTRPLLVQSDFDDTITVGNVSTMIREAFAAPEWREMEKEFYAGKYTVEQSNVRQFALVRASRDEIDELLGARVEVRPGFVEFVRYCESEDIRFVVVSSGLDLYVEPTMSRMGLGHVEAHSAATAFTHDGVRVSYTGPNGGPIANGFKDSFARHFKSQGYTTFYIGDGLSDVGPAGHADHVVARSWLESDYQARGLPYHPFRDFHDVRRHVEAVRGEASGTP